MAGDILNDLLASGIYQIRNRVNGKRYIGSAKLLRKRRNEHFCRLKNGRHHSRHLQASWNKHGRAAFKFEVIELCSPSHLLDREQHWLDSEDPEYNICKVAGNTLGRKHSKETRRKIAKKAVGRKCPPRSAKHRRRLSEIHKGKKKPDHVMAALQAGRARRVYTDEQRRRMADDTRRSYEDGRRSRTKTEDHRFKIGQFFAKLTDDEVREIRRLKLAGVTGRQLAKDFDSNPGTISNICSGKRYAWVK